VLARRISNASALAATPSCGADLAELGVPGIHSAEPAEHRLASADTEI
jgi:hypothetical protein